MSVRSGAIRRVRARRSNDAPSEWVSMPLWLAWRAAGAVLIGVTAVIIAGLEPGAASFGLGSGAVVAAALAARTRREPLVTASIALVALEYLYASQSSSPAQRIVYCIVVAAVVYVVHALASLAPVLERDTSIDPAVMRRFVDRTATFGGAGICTAAMTALVASGGPTWKWFGVLGPVVLVVLVGLSLAPLQSSSRRAHR